MAAVARGLPEALVVYLLGRTPLDIGHVQALGDDLPAGMGAAEVYVACEIEEITFS
jgi:hypothetical protein